MRLRSFFTLLVPLAFASCLGDTSPTTNPLVPIENTTFAAALGVNLAASTKTSDGLYYRDTRTGTGTVVAAGQSVTVKYVGNFANGVQFDAGTYTFSIPGQVIQGWNEGLLGMNRGGARQLIIPPSLAYGSQDYNGIPGNSVLVFTVEPQ